MDISAVNAILRQQKGYKDEIETAIMNYSAKVKTTLNKGYISARLSAIKAIWNNFVVNHNSLSVVLVDDSEIKSKVENLRYFQPTFFPEFEDKYYDFLGILEQDLLNFTNPSNSDRRATDSLQVRLPKIDLPKFDGKYEHWRSFSDRFTALIIKRHNLPDVEKLQYLLECLVGKASSDLKAFDITEANFAAAWSMLKKRYDNKRVLVYKQLKVLLDLTPVKSDTSSAIKSLIDGTREVIHEINALGVPEIEHWNVIIVYILVNKLPSETRKLWEQSLGDSLDLPSFEDLEKFLEGRFRTLESLSDSVNSVQKIKVQTERKAFHVQLNQKLCSFCKVAHAIYACEKFKRSSIEIRRNHAKTEKLCFNCLGQHFLKDCSSKRTCSICHEKHHTLLHNDKQRQQNSSNSSSSRLSSGQESRMGLSASPRQCVQRDISSTSTAELQGVNNSFVHQEVQDFPQRTSAGSISNFLCKNREQEVLLSTALVKIVDQYGASHTFRSLLDTGSQTSIISQKAYSSLKIKGCPVSVEIKGLENTCTAISNYKANFNIRSIIDPEFSLEVSALVVKDISSCLPSRKVAFQNWNHLQNLILADPTFSTPGSIDLILGAEVYANILLGDIRKGDLGTPTALSTSLGWIMIGSSSSGQSPTNFHLETKDASFDLTKFWEWENVVSEEKSMSPEEVECEIFYKNTTVRLSDGSYQVRIPFHKNSPNLGHSRKVAVNQYLSLEKRIRSKSDIWQLYKDSIEEYLQLGHLVATPYEKVKIEMLNPSNILHYYMPHHEVLKDQSSTTKLRVVYNSSFSSSNGRCLNSQMHIGPTIQRSLLSILLSWRKYKFVFTGDIEKMYRQIKLHPDDQSYHRIIWRDKSHSIQDFTMTRLCFGVRASAYLSIRTLFQLADDEMHSYPLASQIVKTDFYVDDLLSGSESIDEALEIQSQLIAMLKKGGFNLRKWTSNDFRLLENIPFEHRELKDTLSISDETSIKTLGIFWHPSKDYFSYKVNLKQFDSFWTKRKILSEISGIFDVIGFLSPIIVAGKIFMQKLWMSKLGWDEPLNLQLAKEWVIYRTNLGDIENVSIPRWINLHSNVQNLQIHAFCDASMQAYAGVIYSRIVDIDGNVYVNLLISKTRVAGINKTTIPRLELCAATLLSEMVINLKKDMNWENVPLFAYTDSSIVLCWINNISSKWQIFVGNRVTKIQNAFPVSCWRHVRSKENPADIASRGCLAKNLANEKLWWEGPSWLLKSPEFWPSSTSNISETKEELKSIHNFSTFINDTVEDLFSRYSSLTKLIRVTAWVLRFKNNLINKRKSNNDRILPLSLQEIQNSDLYLIKIAQQAEFVSEIKALIKNSPIPKQSSILSFSPFVDGKGFLRVGGRLTNAIIPYSKKHPLLLPKRHTYTRLLIQKTHLDTLHGGNQLVHTTILSRFWIVDGKNAIRFLLNKCVICRKIRAETSQQLMGSLPQARVSYSRPFSHVGLDYAGPFDVKSSKIRNCKIYKSYFCIFICFATKAIHIEATTDISTDGFLAAFKRFASRRGLCSDLYSDNGSNFKKASKIIETDFKFIVESSPNVLSNLQKLGIRWHFSPVSSPHWGGIWEAGVRSIKYHLKRSLTGFIPTYEELNTLLVQIEGLLNSRPLCPLNNSVSDIHVITPGHFLTGSNILSLPERALIDSGSTITRWEHIQKLKGQFWTSWTKDYLSRLQQRPKWLSKNPNLQIGDIVLIKDGEFSAGNWPLARITEVHAGQDGLVRVVTVKTQNGFKTRNITKICPLFSPENKEVNSKASYLPRQSRDKLNTTDPDHGSYKLTLTSNEDCINNQQNNISPIKQLSYSEEILPKTKCSNNLPDVLPVGVKLQPSSPTSTASSPRYGSNNNLQSSQTPVSSTTSTSSPTTPSTPTGTHLYPPGYPNMKLLLPKPPAVSPTPNSNQSQRSNRSPTTPSTPPPSYNSLALNQRTNNNYSTDNSSPKYMSQSTIDLKKAHLLESEEGINKLIDSVLSPAQSENNISHQHHSNDSNLLSPFTKQCDFQRTDFVRKLSLEERDPGEGRIVRAELVNTTLSVSPPISKSEEKICIRRDSLRENIEKITQLQSKLMSAHITENSSGERKLLGYTTRKVKLESSTSQNHNNDKEISKTERRPSPIPESPTKLSAPIEFTSSESTVSNSKSSSYEQIKRTEAEAESLQLIQRTELILRVNPLTIETASQTDESLPLSRDHFKNINSHSSSSTKSPDRIIPSPTLLPRRKLSEEIDCDILSKKLASLLPTSEDKLSQILAPTVFKSTADYVDNLYNPNVAPRPAKRDVGTSTPSEKFFNCDRVMEGNDSENNINGQKEHYEILNGSVNGEASYCDLTKKKEELINRLTNKLDILTKEQKSIRDETTSNDQLASNLGLKIADKVRPIDSSKFRAYIDDVGHITMLLLSLSGRLAKLENTLHGINENHPEKKILESKRDRLNEQLEEAKRLKEDIDRRGTNVYKMIEKNLSNDDCADYEYFINMKAKLIIDSREISEKIKLGEEQLGALKDTLLQTEC